MLLDAKGTRHASLIRAAIDSIPDQTEPADPIYRSWARCLRDYGLDPDRQPSRYALEGAALAERQERLESVLSTAKIEMAGLYQQIAGSGYAILLTDSEGVVLHYVGDPCFDEAAHRAGLSVGAVWSEDRQGTNGMGTCIAERSPVVIHCEEHFFTSNIDLTCSAAPVFAPDGNLVAVLDASGSSKLAQQHTMVLVNMSARMIENRLFLANMRDRFILRFHSRPEFINTLGEGAVAFDADGLVSAINRSGLFQLGLDTVDAVRARRIDQLFNISLAQLLTRAKNGLHPMPIHESTDGRRFFALVQPPEETFRQARGRLSGLSSGSVENEQRAKSDDLLDQLEFGDPRMADNVRRARRILDCNIPILLLGKTGTGKGLFAKALHQASRRADKPFVPVNCAAIPESLIESELFGYRPGAFTGASRDGRRGKILQANGGTLFLDEIGDMPLSLQARLLRVLEEREVVPLGGDAHVEVDIMVISATHADLKGLVDKGRFREDLYYRLQGVTFELPALSERADRRALILHLLQLEAGVDNLVLTENALDALQRYPWPGNIRQLRTMLRTMVALRQSDNLTLADVPPELTTANAATAPAVHSADPSDLPASPLQVAEREAIVRLLEHHYWNISDAARHSRVSRNTLYRKMKQYRIRPSRRVE